MTRSTQLATLAAAILCAFAQPVRAQSEIDVLNTAIEAYNDGKS